jgi:hypothetical protein
MNPVRPATRTVLLCTGALLLLAGPAVAQVASPVQSGHYSATMMDVRDLAYPPPGFDLTPFLGPPRVTELG